MAAIILDNVTKKYRKGHLGFVKEIKGVEDLSFEVREGEIFGLLGLNGAGKTTTIKLILGLLYPTKGQIRIFNRIMPDRTVLNDIGYLPEIICLYKYLTGPEILNLFSDLSGISQKEKAGRVEKVLEGVGMGHVIKKKTSEYSKGMLQRIGLAQALLHEPKLLIFDEPISGLDPLALKEMRQLILWLKSQGKTVFFSSHNISEVEKVCDRVGILVNGRLEQILEQEQWRKGEGELERLFTETVAGSGEVGAMSLGDGR